MTNLVDIARTKDSWPNRAFGEALLDAGMIENFTVEKPLTANGTTRGTDLYVERDGLRIRLEFMWRTACSWNSWNAGMTQPQPCSSPGTPRRTGTNGSAPGSTQMRSRTASCTTPLRRHRQPQHAPTRHHEAVRKRRWGPVAPHNPATGPHRQYHWPRRAISSGFQTLQILIRPQWPTKGPGPWLARAATSCYISSSWLAPRMAPRLQRVIQDKQNLDRSFRFHGNLRVVSGEASSWRFHIASDPGPSSAFPLTQPFTEWAAEIVQRGAAGALDAVRAAASPMGKNPRTFDCHSRDGNVRCTRCGRPGVARGRERSAIPS